MPTMGFVPKPQDSWPTWLVVTYYIVMGIIALGFLGVMVLKTFKYLKRGRAGIKTRRGVPRVDENGEYMRVGPGIHPVIPFLDNIEDESVLNVVTNCTSVLAEHKESEGKSRQYVAEVRPTWHIIDTALDLHNAIFLAEDIRDIVATETMCAVGEAIEKAQDVSDRREVTALALGLCADTLNEYGVEVVKLGLVSVVRVPVQVLGDMLGPDSTGQGDFGRLTGALVPTLGLVGGTEGA